MISSGSGTNTSSRIKHELSSIFSAHLRSFPGFACSDKYTRLLRELKTICLPLIKYLNSKTDTLMLEDIDL